MMKKIFLTFACVIATALNVAAQPLSVYDLRCCHAATRAFVETEAPVFGWKIFSEERGCVQSGYQIIVADNQTDIDRNEGNVWDSGRRESRESLAVPFEGKKLKAAKQYFWKARIWDGHGRVSAWSEMQTFATTLTSEKDWGNAKWIALEKDNANWRVVPGCHGSGEAKDRLGERCNDVGKYRLPQFRKEISLKKEIKRATAYVAGLGHFDFFINGHKVGNHFLDAGWTNYDKLANYVAFDVTADFQNPQRKIALGVMLGGGFYNIPGERYYKVLTSFGAPKMRLLLQVEYADGSEERILSDQTWRVTESPITYTSIYGGEDYDARREIVGWRETGFDDSAWQKPIVSSFGGQLKLQTSDPLTVHSELPVQRVFRNAKGQKVYDLGQNFSGIVRLQVKSNKPRTIILRPAELLNPDSTVNQSASGEPYYFSYTTHGNDVTETWQPQFTYYGFRYVQVEGDDAEIQEITGLHTCNSAPEAGTFACSNPLFNQTHTLIDWAMRSNMASVLTDCPHREKLGWLEQAHLMQYSLLYRYDLVRLYAKIMEDMRQSQREDGCIPSICPEYVRFADGFEDSPEWGSSFIISPWYIYKWYGDTSLLAEYYPDMQRYLAYLDTRASDGIVAYGLGDWFDIGPKSPGRSQLTDLGVTATAMYFYNASIMAQVAELLGKKDDATAYTKKANKIRETFNRKYFHSDTRTLDRNSQTANAIALYFGLVEEENRTTLVENLVNDIHQRGNALTAGDVGYRYVLRALEQAGRSDVIFDMNSRYDVPGYGWQLAHGATALTESWQAYGFVSNNHFMLGHLMEWLYSGLAGIGQTDRSVAFSEVFINPQIVGDIRHAQATYYSPYGQIFSRWQKHSDGSLTIEVTIPANTTAQVVLPINEETEGKTKRITEHGLPVAQSKDIRLSTTGHQTIAHIGSGHYLFRIER